MIFLIWSVGELGWGHAPCFGQSHKLNTAILCLSFMTRRGNCAIGPMYRYVRHRLWLLWLLLVVVTRSFLLRSFLLVAVSSLALLSLLFSQLSFYLLFVQKWAFQKLRQWNLLVAWLCMRRRLKKRTRIDKMRSIRPSNTIEIIEEAVV